MVSLCAACGDYWRAISVHWFGPECCRADAKPRISNPVVFKNFVDSFMLLEFCVRYVQHFLGDFHFP
ncbi:hypothetical protein VNO77_22249 [Canavalia gladiata]|uniref:Uncharacterized protein n=1 Tax=Canavalia gladiata TaxID=3824 RepID=A0AAN9L2F3_CANGL